MKVLLILIVTALFTVSCVTTERANQGKRFTIDRN